jgi:homoserine acetyltransferase
MSDYETYDLGDFTLQSGEIIPDAKIAYKTFGDPSLPAIIYPTWYSGRTFPPLPIYHTKSHPQLTPPQQ